MGMTSVMDSSLRDDGRDMLRMSNMMGTERDIDLMGMNQQRYSNIMMGRNRMGHNMMGQETMGRNLMGQDSMGPNMMSKDNMGRNVMRQGNMMGQDRTSQMISQNQMGQQNV